jgi:hypothetical protein
MENLMSMIRSVALACVLASSAVACLDAADEYDGYDTTRLALTDAAPNVLKVQFTTVSKTATTFSAKLVVTNVSGRSLSSWAVDATLPGGATVSANPAVVSKDTQITYRDYSFSGGALASGASATLNFSGTLAQGQYTGANKCTARGVASGVTYTQQTSCNGSSDRTPPSAPTAVKYRSVNATHELILSPSSDGSGIQGYRIIGVWPAQFGRRAIASTAATSIVLTDTAPTYEVTAIDNAGNESLVATSTQVIMPTFTFRKTGSWAGSYNGEIVMTNVSSASLSNWSFSFVQPDVTNMWNATWTKGASNRQIATAPSYAPTLAAGANVAVGFSVGSSGYTVTPTGCQYQGFACTIVYQ